MASERNSTSKIRGCPLHGSPCIWAREAVGQSCQLFWSLSLFLLSVKTAAYFPLDDKQGRRGNAVGNTTNTKYMYIIFATISVITIITTTWQWQPLRRSVSVTSHLSPSCSSEGSLAAFRQCAACLCWVGGKGKYKHKQAVKATKMLCFSWVRF